MAHRQGLTKIKPRKENKIIEKVILPKNDRILMRMGPSDAEFHAESEFHTPGTIGAQKGVVMMNLPFPQKFLNFPKMKNGHEKGPQASYRAENLHARSSR